MSDLIKREDAIKAIEELPNAYNGWSDAYDKAYIIGTLEEVPKADRPQGEWIDIDNYYSMATCSHCHKVTMFEKWGEYIRSYNFCPNCGSKMRGEHDD